MLGHVGGDKLKIIGSLIGDTNRLSQNQAQPHVQRQVSQLLKKKRAADQKWACGHCKNILDASYEVDHIIPLYKGGSNDESNLIALCRNCHGKKTVEDRLS
jgi:5-methylcytosine-specific restriction protein A